jgi:hypothetical protein
MEKAPAKQVDRLKIFLENGGVLESKRATGEPRCQHIKADLTQCNAIITGGFQKCRAHGAGTRARPGGKPANPTRVFKQRYLETLGGGKLTDKVLNFLADPNFLEMRDEIALLRAFTDDQIEVIQSVPALITDARAAVIKLEDAFVDGSVDRIKRHFDALKRALDSAHASRLAVMDIRGLIQEQRVIVESERKRAVESQMMVGLDTFMGFMARIRDIILLRVEDPQTKRAIANDLRAELQHRGPNDLEKLN